MKAEHRKELQTNVLADKVGKFLQGLRTRPDATTLTILAFVILGAGLFFGWRYWRSYSERTRSALWLRLDEAATQENLDAVIKDGGSGPAGRVALFHKARDLLHAGLHGFAAKSAVNDGKSPREQLEEAHDLYDKLAKESQDSPLLVQEALMGVAKAKESLAKNQDDLDGAVAAYKALADRYPASV